MTPLALEYISIPASDHQLTSISSFFFYLNHLNLNFHYSSVQSESCQSTLFQLNQLKIESNHQRNLINLKNPLHIITSSSSFHTFLKNFHEKFNKIHVTQLNTTVISEIEFQIINQKQQTSKLNESDRDLLFKKSPEFTVDPNKHIYLNLIYDKYLTFLNDVITGCARK